MRFLLLLFMYICTPRAAYDSTIEAAKTFRSSQRQPINQCRLEPDIIHQKPTVHPSVRPSVRPTTIVVVLVDVVVVLEVYSILPPNINTAAAADRKNKKKNE